MKVVTLARLERAMRTAIADFEACGLYTDELHAVPVRLTWGHSAYGLCWETGEIDIPAVSLSRLGEMFGWPRVALTDVVRHEMAHALAHVHLDVVDGAEFEDVFGGRYWEAWETPPTFEPDLFVSRRPLRRPAIGFRRRSVEARSGVEPARGRRRARRQHAETVEVIVATGDDTLWTVLDAHQARPRP